MSQDISSNIIKDSASLHVLIADRHQGARNILRSMLISIGIKKIDLVSSSTEVLRLIEANPFDIIIVDFILEEGRDGLTLLAELRHKQLIPMMTVYIITTSERAHQNVIAVAELEPDAYILKPFTEDILKTRIVRSIQKKKFCKPVLEFLDRRFYSDALLACEELLQKDSPFAHDILRIKGKLLNTLERYQEAFDTYRKILETSHSPYARIGLAKALHGLGKAEDAKVIAATLIEKHHEFMEAYDFLAVLHEELGDLPQAQSVLQKAVLVSPKHTARHQSIADIAVRNDDLETAERFYQKVLDAHRGSSMLHVDNYANLARTSLKRGKTDAARTIIENMRRDWRTSKPAEFAALTLESLCFSADKMQTRAAQVFTQAMSLRDELHREGVSLPSQRLSVDFAHICLSNGKPDLANDIFKKVAAENNENSSVLAHIQDIFKKEGKEKEGKELLQNVLQEIIKLNNSGISAAKSGDLEGAVRILVETADRVPNLQFLVNASKAIFTLIEKKGWNEELSQRGVRYLRAAYKKDSTSARVLSACDLYQRVAKAQGREVVAIESPVFV